jgi:hypothetical protein
MKALNRNQQFPQGFPMRGVRAVMVSLVASLALPGCMQAAGSGSMRVVVPLVTAVSPGDTVLVGERWF